MRSKGGTVVRVDERSEPLMDVHCMRFVLDGRACPWLDAVMSIMATPMASPTEAVRVLRDIAIELRRRRYAWLAAGVVSRAGIHAMGAHEQVEAWLEPVFVGDVVGDEPEAVSVTVVIATAAGALAPWRAASCEDVREILESIAELRPRDMFAVNAAVHLVASDEEVRAPGAHDPVLVRDRVIVEIELAQPDTGALAPGAAEDPRGGRCSA